MASKILIVDDDAPIRELVRMVLSDAGYSVVLASDGVEGVEMFQKENPDLVLLDILMPRRNGIDACKKMRESNAKHTPILMFTVSSNDENRRSAYEAGCNGYITKPFDAEELVKEIEKHLTSKASSLS
ncbi:MAG TPA: response regulator [Candidatus Acidoferrales bacterium]|nr:response regulator [Candidatus Acidoferrales bacterium]